MPTPILYDSHTHTPLCKHALGEPTEYAAVAERRGLKGLIITCHNPMPKGFAATTRMDPPQWRGYLDLVACTRAEWAGRVDVRLGLECDYFPGFEAFLEKQTATPGLNYVLGSVHCHLDEYLARYGAAEGLAFQRTYFDLLGQAAETRCFDALAHLDWIKNFLPEWDPVRVHGPICRCLDRMAAAGVALECNTSGLDRATPEIGPTPFILREARARSIPVVLGSDAHQPEQVGRHFAVALNVLEAVGYREVSYFIERKRQTTPIAKARTSMRS